MSLEEMNKFFSAFYTHEWRWKVLYLCMSFLGLRIGEAVRIKLEDVDFQNKQIRIRTEKQGPYEVMDAMYLHERLEGLLIDYVSEYEREITKHEGYLFYPETGTGSLPYTSPDMARNVFRRICDRAGLTECYGNRESISGLNFKRGKLHKLTTHSLRYAFAQYLRRKNVPVEIRQHLMRHTDRASLQIYDAPQKSEVDETLKQVFSR